MPTKVDDHWIRGSDSDLPDGVVAKTLSTLGQQFPLAVVAKNAKEQIILLFEFVGPFRYSKGSFCIAHK